MYSGAKDLIFRTVACVKRVRAFCIATNQRSQPEREREAGGDERVDMTSASPARRRRGCSAKSWSVRRGHPNASAVGGRTGSQPDKVSVFGYLLELGLRSQPRRSGGALCTPTSRRPSNWPSSPTTACRHAASTRPSFYSLRPSTCSAWRAISLFAQPSHFATTATFAATRALLPCPRAHLVHSVWTGCTRFVTSTQR